MIIENGLIAAGKIPGGFFKREGKPSDRATLVARMIDRPIRPLFPDEYRCATHVVCFVLSHDQENSPDILAILGASTALMLSDLPFQGPVSAARVGRVQDEFVLNPTVDQLSGSDLNITVVSSPHAIVMVEGGGAEVSESDMVQALKFAYESVQVLNSKQIELAKKVGKTKRILEKEKIECLDADGEPIDVDAYYRGV